MGPPTRVTFPMAASAARWVCALAVLTTACPMRAQAASAKADGGARAEACASYREAWREATERGSVSNRTVQRLRARKTLLLEEQARSAAEPAVAVRVAFGLALAGVEPATNTGRVMAPYFRWLRSPATGMSIDVEDVPLVLLALYRQDGSPSTAERMLAMRGDGALAQNRNMALASALVHEPVPLLRAAAKRPTWERALAHALRWACARDRAAQARCAGALRRAANKAPDVRSIASLLLEAVRRPR